MHLNCEHPNEHHKVQETRDHEWHGITDSRPESLAESPHERASTSNKGTAVFTDQQHRNRARPCLLLLIEWLVVQ